MLGMGKPGKGLGIDKFCTRGKNYTRFSNLWHDEQAGMHTVANHSWKNVQFGHFSHLVVVKKKECGECALATQDRRMTPRIVPRKLQPMPFPAIDETLISSLYAKWTHADLC